MAVYAITWSFSVVKLPFLVIFVEGGIVTGPAELEGPGHGPPKFSRINIVLACLTIKSVRVY